MSNRTEAARTAAAIRQEVEAEISQFARIIFRGLVQRYGIAPGTPIDRRQARSGWNVGLGRRPPARVPTGKGVGVYFQPADDFDVAAALAGFRLRRKIVINNPVKHMGILDRGRRRQSNGRMGGSLQAPHGVVKFAIDQAEIVMRRQRGR